MNNNFNITFIIGNGFDIGILTALNKKYKTTYQEFYNYLSYYLVNKENFIYKEIQRLEGTSLWADFELILKEAVENEIRQGVDAARYQYIIDAWEEIQYLFADFMNQVVTPNTLKLANELNGKMTLERFLGDLSEADFKHCHFAQNIDHHATIDYNFFNFNYSLLLDNYIYWRFDPHPYLTAENNSRFYDHPHDESSWGLSVKISKNVYHPHGSIPIPASILFGMSTNQRYENSTIRRNDARYYEIELRKRLDKAYWCMAEDTFEPIINKTELFVIYGHSIGETDSWWWEKIIDRLINSNSELIIYDYSGQCLKDRILEYCPAESVCTVSERIYVVYFDEINTLTYGFNFR